MVYLRRLQPPFTKVSIRLQPSIHAIPVALHPLHLGADSVQALRNGAVEALISLVIHT